MVNIPNAKSEQTKKARTGRKAWSHFIRVMAMVVVFCTTYALILPAITLESGTVCGVGEHTHTEECYQAVETVACEIPESEGHAHADACYTIEENALTCTLEEVAAHTHSEACAGQVLVCTLEEAAGHTHSETCNTEISALICAEAESETHTHSDACYQVETRTCALEESEGHAHSDACYEAGNVCALTETEGHAHVETCYASVQTLTCGLEESEGHSHADDAQTMELVCELNEHVHTEECYPVTEETTTEETEATEQPVSDPTADVETAADWEASMASVELTGDWSVDLLAVARSQMGYTESTRNFVVSESGDVSGYTRYGAWYGIPYGDWCAMFVSFCLEYAGVEDISRGAGCNTWKENLIENNQYFPADKYTPVPGDLIFFGWDEDERPDHVGIVEQIIVPEIAENPEEQEPVKVRVIEGNSSNRVRYVDYTVDDATIMGYGVLPTEPGPTYEYADDSVQVKVVLPKDTAVPETATLSVTPIESGADGYDSLVEKANNAVDGTVTKIKLYDISFYAEDGTYIPVDDEAKVSIRFVESVVDVNANVEVLHFAEDDAEPVVLAGVTVAEEVPVVEEEPKTLEELSAPIVDETEEIVYIPETVVEFKTDGFSLFAVIEVDTNEVAVYGEPILTYNNAENILTLNQDEINGGSLDGKIVMISTNAEDKKENVADDADKTDDTGYKLLSSEIYDANHLNDAKATKNGNTLIPEKLDNNVLWKFIKTDTAGAYLIQSVDKGTYLKLQVEGDNTATTLVAEENNPTAIYPLVDGDIVRLAPQANLDGRELSLNEDYDHFCAYGSNSYNQLVLAEVRAIETDVLEAGQTYNVDGKDHPLHGKYIAISTADEMHYQYPGITHVVNAVNQHDLDALAIRRDGNKAYVADSMLWRFEKADAKDTYYIRAYDVNTKTAGQYMQINGGNNVNLVDTPNDNCKIKVGADGNGSVTLTRGDRYLCYNLDTTTTGDSFTGYGTRVDEKTGKDRAPLVLSVCPATSDASAVNCVTDLGGQTLAIVSARADQAVAQIPTQTNKYTAALGGANVVWVEENNAVNVPDDAEDLTSWTFVAVNAEQGVYNIRSADGKYLRIGNETAELSDTPQDITVVSQVIGGIEYVGLYADGVYLNDFGEKDSSYAGYGGENATPEKDTGSRFILAKKVDATLTAKVVSRRDLRNMALIPNSQLIFFVKQVENGVDHYYAVRSDGTAEEIYMLSDELAEGAIFYSDYAGADLRWDATGSPTGNSWNTANNVNGAIDLWARNLDTGRILCPNNDGGYGGANKVEGDKGFNLQNTPSITSMVQTEEDNTWYNNEKKIGEPIRGEHNASFIKIDNAANFGIKDDIASMIISDLAYGDDDTQMNDGTWRMCYNNGKFTIETIDNYTATKGADNAQKNVFYVAMVDNSELTTEEVSTDTNLVGQILSREEFQAAAGEYGDNWPFFVIAQGTDGNYYAVDAYGQAQPVEFIKDNKLEAGGRFIFRKENADTSSYGEREYNPNLVLWNPYATKFNSFATNNAADGWVELWMSNVATHTYLCPGPMGMTTGFPLEGEFSPGFFYSDDLNDGISSYLASLLGQVKDDGTIDNQQPQGWYELKLNTEQKKFEVQNYWGTTAGGTALGSGLDGAEYPEYVFYVAMLVDRNVTYNAETKTVAEYQSFTGVNENVKMKVFNYGAAIDLYGQNYNKTEIVTEVRPGVPNYLNYGNDLVYRFFYRPAFTGEAIDGTNDPNNADQKAEGYGNNLYSDGSDPMDNGNYRLFAPTLLNGYPAILEPKALSCATEAHTHDNNCGGEGTCQKAVHTHTRPCYNGAVLVNFNNEQQMFSLQYLFDAKESFVGNTVSDANTDYKNLVISDSSANGDLHAIIPENGTEVNSQLVFSEWFEIACTGNGSWNEVENAAPATRKINLVEGVNVIEIGAANGYAPNVVRDGIVVAGQKIDPSDITLYNGVTENNDGNTYNQITGNATIRFQVEVEATGEYDISIAYASGEDRNLGIRTVSGTTPPADEADSVTANPNYAVRSYDVGNGTTTGLFQKDANGYYYYDSKANAATFNPQTGLFELYNFAMIPGGYNNLDGGNFLPFNDATTQGRWIDASTIDTGGDTILPNTVAKANRYYRLNGFEQNDNTTTGRESMADLWMGMSMEIMFTMTNDGKIRVSRDQMIDGELVECELYETNDGYENSDTDNLYWYDPATEKFYTYDDLTEVNPANATQVRNDLVFNFAGDDDVLVYVDNVLVMDINGIHGVWRGSIDFATGQVTNDKYSGSYTDGMTIKALFEYAGQGDVAAQAEGETTKSKFGTGELAETFAPGSQHTLKFFYLERGGNISDCAISFNLEPMETGTLSVEKQVEGVTANDYITDAEGKQHSYNTEFTFQLIDIVQPYDSALATKDPASKGVIWRVPYKLVDKETPTNNQSGLYLNLHAVTLNGTLQLETADNDNNATLKEPAGSKAAEFEVCRFYANGLPDDPNNPGNQTYITTYRLEENNKVYFFTDYDDDGLYRQTDVTGSANAEDVTKFFRVFNSDTFTLKNHQQALFEDFILNTLVKVKEYPAANGIELGTTYWWETVTGGEATSGNHEAQNVNGSMVSKYFKIVNTGNVEVVCKNLMPYVNLGIKKVVNNPDNQVVDTTYKIKYTITYPNSEFYGTDDAGKLYAYNLVSDTGLIDTDKDELLRQNFTNVWDLESGKTYGTVVDTNADRNTDTFMAAGTINGNELDPSEYMWTVNVPFGSSVEIDELWINGYKVDWTYVGYDNQYEEGAYLDTTDGQYYVGTGEQKRVAAMVYRQTDAYGGSMATGSSATTPAKIQLLAEDNYVVVTNEPVPSDADLSKNVIAGSQTQEFSFDYSYTDATQDGGLAKGTLTMAHGGSGEVTGIPRGSTLTIKETNGDGYMTDYDVVTVISAEEMDLNGASQVGTNSYLHHIGYIKGTESTAGFSIYVPEAREYPITLSYGQYVNEQFPLREFAVAVEPVETVIECESTGDWNGFTKTAEAQIYLEAGVNQIVIGGVGTDFAPDVALNGVKFNNVLIPADDIKYTEGVTESTDRFGSIRGTTATLRFTVDVANAGNYPVAITYAQEANRSFSISAWQKVDCEPTGSWYPANENDPNAWKTSTINVKLNAGHNFITIGGWDGGDAPNLNSVTVTLATQQAGKEFTAVVYDSLQIVCNNESGYELPESGGMGTHLYILGGLFMMAVPVVYYGISKRSRRERRAGA